MLICILTKQVILFYLNSNKGKKGNIYFYKYAYWMFDNTYRTFDFMLFISYSVMAYASPLYLEDDIGVEEVHYSPQCWMVRTPYNLYGQHVLIFVRKCVCKKYENTYKHGIDFEYDDLDVDGVFIHFHGNCFHRRMAFTRRRRIYIFETHCNCEYEQLSYH